MKTAVSVPDDVFHRAERLARSTRRSRSELYSAALREYVARHSPDEVTEVLNRLADSEEPVDHAFALEAGHRTLKKTEW